MRRLTLLFLLAVLGMAGAQGGSYWPLYPDSFALDGSVIHVQGPLGEDYFIPGIGWSSGSDDPPPQVSGGELLLAPESLERLGFSRSGDPVTPTPEPVPARRAAEPQGVSVRFGGDVQVRIVVDLPHVRSSLALQELNESGRLESGEVLEFDLPHDGSHVSIAERYGDIHVRLDSLGSRLRLRVQGPSISYFTFTLDEPTRFVIDAVPLRDAVVDERSRQLRPGVTHRVLAAQTPVGQSEVQLLEIEPGYGELRVVGVNGAAEPLSRLAGGAYAAINAGYFDTQTNQTVGLLQIDGSLLSLPSRNRASFGVGPNGPLIARTGASVHIDIGAQTLVRNSNGTSDGVQLYTSAGALVGSPRRGQLVVDEGRVIANRIGPVRVPAGGFVLAYPPADRELALVDPGARLDVDVRLEPGGFNFARHAVEAGPLLVENGFPAFDPEAENFPRGQRILDAYTQQAAIGVRPDGTVLMLAASAMRAQDLVPLFLELGASDAMRLDSGSSTTLIADGQVLNRTSERRIVSGIVYVPHR